MTNDALIALRLPQKLEVKAKLEAKNSGVSFSELVRQALAQYLKSSEVEQ
ncbi:MAG: ribbon-helix-helix protein, CopG family [Anaerolineae bacterium]|nr:ribbon-helix-helix protein, CopG family [Anaerolineae bacterium]